MNLRRIFAKATPLDRLNDMVAEAARELEAAEMQHLVATDNLHSADASLEFCRNRLLRLQSLQDEPVPQEAWHKGVLP